MVKKSALIEAFFLLRTSSHRSFDHYLQVNPEFRKALAKLSYFGGIADELLYEQFYGMYEK